MEISFILTALRQRGWLIALFLAVGALVASTIDQPVEDRYRSTALIQIAPPNATQNVFNENLDRYVKGELTVLQSTALAAAVADRVGLGVSPSTVRSAASFDQVPLSNVIEISATSTDAALAQAIAAAYAGAYLERADALDQGALSDDLRVTNERIIELADELEGLDNQIAAVLAPFVRVQGQPQAPPVPDPRQIVPELVTRRELRLTEYNQLLDRRIQLGDEDRGTVLNTEVQEAIEAAPVAVQSVLPIQIAIVVVAGLFGLVAALLATQFRRRFGDERQGEAVLGRRIVARLPAARQLRHSPLAALGAPPRSHDEDIRRLWAQTDRLGPLNETLVIAVTGAQRRAGTTTVALELAHRYAASGRRTVLIDGDGDDQWLSDAFAGRDEGAIERILRGEDPASALARTGDPHLFVAGRTPGTTIGLHREGIHDLITAIAPLADVIVVDSGAALSSASALEACAASHAVVLATPLFRMTRVQLEEVVFELTDVADRLLPVITLPSRRRGNVNAQRPLELSTGEQVGGHSLRPVPAGDGDRGGWDHGYQDHGYGDDARA